MNARIIVLTDEQKKEREDRVNGIEKTRSFYRSRCRCGKKYNILHVAKCGFPGFCSLKCFHNRDKIMTTERKPLRLRPRLKTRKEWKQFRRQEIIEKKKAGTFDFFKSSDWRKLRFKILRKYGFRCMACGLDNTKTVLHVDHIKPRSKYPSFELDPNNLQVLCEDCNMGKSDKYEGLDLRPQIVQDECSDFLTDAAKKRPS